MKYLGVDFGLKRIGLSVSEGQFASPLKIITVSGLEDSVNKIIREAGEFGVDKLIVGMPESSTGKAAKRFVENLKRKGLNVETTDETLSTKQALKLMIEMGIPKKKRKVEDCQAAAIILQNYLDSKV
ncbi:MAG: putative Holliday junction resolvase [Microgenomates group bacterium Gr01-1014_93]|nr:MAG: putative Holliday junction resolvase [Microgenomates group bacterium Gr01-1014_93]